MLWNLSSELSRTFTKGYLLIIKSLDCEIIENKQNHIRFQCFCGMLSGIARGLRASHTLSVHIVLNRSVLCLRHSNSGPSLLLSIKSEVVLPGKVADRFPWIILTSVWQHGTDGVVLTGKTQPPFPVVLSESVASAHLCRYQKRKFLGLER